MKVGTISSAINFKGTEQPVRLTAEERAEIKKNAKAFEDKLVLIGQDSFVKRHEAARKEEQAIYGKANYCIIGRDCRSDSVFGSPEERFQYLLRKARKYQTDEAIDSFTDKKSQDLDQAVAHLKDRIEICKKQIRNAEGTIHALMTNRTAEIKSGTATWMKQKVADLEKFFRESQEISPRHKEVKEKLASGELP